MEERIDVDASRMHVSSLRLVPTTSCSSSSPPPPPPPPPPASAAKAHRWAWCRTLLATPLESLLVIVAIASGPIFFWRLVLGWLPVILPQLSAKHFLQILNCHREIWHICSRLFNGRLRPRSSFLRRKGEITHHSKNTWISDWQKGNIHMQLPFSSPLVRAPNRSRNSAILGNHLCTKKTVNDHLAIWPWKHAVAVETRYGRGNELLPWKHVCWYHQREN